MLESKRFAVFIVLLLLLVLISSCSADSIKEEISSRPKLESGFNTDNQKLTKSTTSIRKKTTNSSIPKKTKREYTSTQPNNNETKELENVFVSSNFDVNYKTFDGSAYVQYVAINQIDTQVTASLTVINMSDKNMHVFPINVDLYNSKGLKIGYVNVAGPFVTPNSQSLSMGSGIIMTLDDDIEVSNVQINFNVVLS